MNDFNLSVGCIEHKCSHCGSLIPRNSISTTIARTESIPYPSFFDSENYFSYSCWTDIIFKGIGCKTCKTWRNITVDLNQNDLYEDDRYYGEN